MVSRTASLLALALLGSNLPSRAETIYMATSDDALITVDSASPGTISSSVPIGGLGPLERVLGLDFRPATGGLYALIGGVEEFARLVVIDPATGGTTQVGATFGGGDVSAGFDFDPTTGRIRWVDNSTHRVCSDRSERQRHRQSVRDRPRKRCRGGARRDSVPGSRSTA